MLIATADFRPSPKLVFNRRSPNGQELRFDAMQIETQLLLHVATAMGITWRALDDSYLIEFKYQGNSQCVYKAFPQGSMIANWSCKDKAATNCLMRNRGLSSSNCFLIRSKDPDTLIEAAFNALKKPVVVKLTHNTHGDGVIVGVNDVQTCLTTVRQLFAAPYYKEGNILIEEQFYGKEFRIIATNTKTLAVMHRIPAFVIGDGKHTVSELIEQKNQLPIRNISQDLYPHIAWDDEMAAIVSKQGLNSQSVPSEGQNVTLRNISNVMAGGEAIDYTDIVHQSIKDIAVQAIKAIPGLNFGGIDFMTADESIEQTADTYRIIEINSSPEFAMHDLPMNGTPRGVAQEFLLQYFPELRTQFS